MFPSSDSIFRLPLPSTGSLRLGSPASQVLSEAPTPVILLSALRCLRLDIPSVCTLFAFPSAWHWLTKTWRFRFSTWLPLTAIIRWRLTGSPRFLGNLLYTCPALRSRRNPTILPLRWLDAAFRWSQLVGFRIGDFGTLSHGLCTRCLRFATESYLSATQDSLPAAG